MLYVCVPGQPRRNNTYPLAANTNMATAAATRQNVTAPLPSGKRSGELCVEKGCQRYGDPAQGHRCYQHYVEATSRLPRDRPTAIPPPQTPYTHNEYGLVQAQPPPGTQPTYVGSQTARNPPAHTTQPPHPPHAPAQEDTFTQAFSRLENSRRNMARCLNHNVIGCQNFGNTRNHGYCNSCFQQKRLHIP